MPPVKPLVLWGARGHAKVLNEFMQDQGYRLVALFDNDPERETLLGVPIYKGESGFRKWLAATEGVPSGLVAIGGASGHDRLMIQDFFVRHGIEIVTALHPTAFLAKSASIGAGSQILAQSAVGADAQIGRGCIVNTKASVDHECRIGDGVHLAPGSTLAGCVSVGDCSFIAIGATVLPRIDIGRNALIGAGSIVTRDVPDNAVVYGQPARLIRWNPVANRD